jgi:histidinol dehydrogenase
MGRQLEKLPRKATAEEALETYGALFVVSKLSEAFELANDMAPEHLELHLEEPFQYLDRIRNAGAVFLGPFTPEPVGDYTAGPNHVLPTAGTARFSSALSVNNFVKKTSVVYYSEQAFKKDAADIVRLAEIEGLSAHAHAVKIRREN